MHDGGGGGGFGGGHMGGGHMGSGHVGGHAGTPAAHHHHGSPGSPGMVPGSPGYLPGAEQRGHNSLAAAGQRFAPVIALVAFAVILAVVVLVVH